MDNKLYRIEVIAWDNLPSINTTGMLYTNEGMAFVRLRPVKLQVQPKRKVQHGHWIDARHALGFFSPRCSVCGQFNKYHEKYNYCPNCGAQMNGGKTNE